MVEALGAWDNFYVIVGSAGGALTGLQFVVMALVSDNRVTRNTDQVDAFATPTVVHFCAVLGISAAVTAPWPDWTGLRAVLRVVGLAGLVYSGIVIARARRQTGYTPVLEDWIWHTVLPVVAYAAVAGATIGMNRTGGSSLFVLAATTLLLLFIGIHNSWDTVTWVVVNADARVETPRRKPRARGR